MGVEFLVNELKKRDNKNKIGIVVGEIVDVKEFKEYVKISILNGAIQTDNFYSLIYNFTEKDIGKKVIVSATENNQEIIVLGYFKKFKGGV